jgi:hypothetical protein
MIKIEIYNPITKSVFNQGTPILPKSTGKITKKTIEPTSEAAFRII